MGVPAFFRWLSRKYPSVIVDCVENRTNDDEGNPIPEDTSQPNPNGVEFDNLYLDMNGIIHPCTHPEDKPAPKNEDEMMVAIFECIDRLFAIVRPRKVLYMAIDGVAPRAKMNQQRSRRFRASKETAEKILEMARIREQLEAAGAKLPPVKEKGEHFDSNCITPGTPFMEKLSRCLHYYIHDRLNSDPGWKDIKVILSDANVPGEGEHKIMDYIRKQRAQPDHDPNTQHVLCGADADLIMLGLATHEPNFTIIREEFLPNKPRPCEMCGQIGHEMAKCQGLNEAISDADAPPPAAEVRFIFVRLFVLREYLFRTLAMPNLPFKYDFDRAIDDWVFMCFFVGNDFLPHLPSLEIRENAIDRLIELYKKCVYKTMGWLTDSGEVNLDRVQMILSDLGMAEDQIFKERQRKEVMFKEREKAKKRRTQGPSFNEIMNTPWAPQAVGRGGAPQAIQNARIEAARIRMAGGTPNTNPLEALLKPVDSDEQKKGVKRKIDDGATEEKQDDEAEDYQKNDEVRLWEDGFKDRYYESKFDVPADNQNFRYSVALQYVRGLCWVLKYYYQGCASWKWYFPYHYAPFASDFINIVGLSTEFEKNTIPFKPLEQLMGVFPAASCSHVPEPWGILMSSPTSPIIDFYPTDFKIDLNGKKFAWQGVALLPFVDERRLFKALKPYYKYLTPAEIARNIRGDDRLYVGPQNRGYKFISALYNEHEKTSEEEFAVLIDGMQGTVLLAVDCVPVDGRLDCPINGLRDIDVNNVLSVRYRDPKYADTFVFPAKWLPGAIEPPKTLGPEDDRPNNYRPVVGFNRNHVGQASLGGAGHRMMDFSMRGGGGQGGRGGGYGGQSNSGGGMRNYNSNSSYNDNRQGGGSDWSQNRNRNYGSSGGYQQNQQHYQGGGGGGGNGGGGRGGGYNSQYSNNQGGNNNWQQRNNYGQQPYQQRNNRGGGGNSRGGGGGAYQRGGSQQQGFWK